MVHVISFYSNISLNYKLVFDDDIYPQEGFVEKAKHIKLFKR